MENKGRRKWGPKSREVPRPAGGKSGILGSLTENAPERDCVFEHREAVRIEEGTETPCWRLSGNKSTKRERKERGCKEEKVEKRD